MRIVSQRTAIGRRKNLVVVRAGRQSCHHAWLGTPADNLRTWDLCVFYYDKEPESTQNADIVVFEKGGFKFEAIARLFKRIDFLSAYENFWFVDDDIMCTPQQINDLFTITDEFDLWLAQPALTPTSYGSHAITLGNPRCLLRYTNFVEVMMPVFSRKGLKACIYTFEDSVTAWGLDFIWHAVLGKPRAKVAIIDAVSVEHTRPVGTGAVYKDAAGRGVAPFAELLDNLKRYDLTDFQFEEYGAIRRSPHVTPFGTRSQRDASRGDCAGAEGA